MAGFASPYGFSLPAIDQAVGAREENALRKMLLNKQSGQIDRDIGKQNALAQWLNPALGGDKNALAQVMAVDAETGLKVANYLKPAAAAAPTNLEKLIAARDKLPEGDPRRSYFDGAIAKESAAPDKNPIFQDRPLPGDMIQKVVSYDGGRTFQNFGASYDRRDPMIIQDIHQEDGTIVRAAVPRPRPGNPAMAQPGGPQSGPQPAAQPGLPAGSVPINTTPPKRTDEQNKAAGFSDRMLQSMGAVDQFEKSALDLGNKAASNIPVVGNYMVSNDFQQLEQAQRDYINAVLRRESGAVISPEEFDNARKQYFPQPGDTPETLEQKRRNRIASLDGMKRSAGPGYEGKLPQGARPYIGYTDGGYRYKGGDPSKPESWGKI